MMRKGLLLTTAFVLMSGSALAEDEELPTSGTCGTDCTWSYDESTKTIKISGSGKMYNYEENTQEWIGYKSIAENIIIEGVENVGARSFLAFNNIKNVQMDDSVTSLETGCFGGLLRLEKIKLSNNLKYIYSSALQQIGGYVVGGVKDLVFPESTVILSDLKGINVDTLVIPSSFPEKNIQNILFSSGYEYWRELASVQKMYCTGAQLSACYKALEDAGIAIEPTRYEKTKDGVVVYDNNGHIVGKYKNTQAIGDGKIDAIYKYSDSGHFIGTFDTKGNRIGKKIYTVEEAMEATKDGERFRVYLTYK